MKIYRQSPVCMAVLALMFALILGPGFSGTARAASEDVAIFYDDLSQYGQWAEYENYGPVWQPSQVPENWQPYTDGRWVPTDNGYVFESQEPWGWATYHYGNWMPTEGHGWVWVPGRTWYPSTVEWRTSPENTPPDDSYVGWAPTPPPDYVPPPAYAPPPSYSQGNPVVDALTAPFWIFAKAASFLLGLGEPFAPSYSYVNAGVLMPPPYVQVFYPQTVIVRRYYTPAYYPPAFFGGRSLPFAAYNWGPPPAYIYRTARINQAIFNRAVHNNSLYITRIHNVAPPGQVINRYGYLKQIMPPALAQGRALPPPHRVENYRMAQANLYKPNILPPPQQVPPVKAQFSKLQPVAGFQPGHVVQPSRPTGPGRVTAGSPATPATPGIHPQPGHVPSGRPVPGEFRPGPPHAAEPRATQSRPTPASPGYRPTTPEHQQQLERDRQRRQQEALRQQQAPREQQVRQQELQRQQQLHRQQQTQELQRRHPQGVQRQQQQHEQPQRQVHPQVKPQPTPRPQPQVQPRPQPQQQQRQKREHEQHQRRPGEQQ
jgi:flagellar biosynthesis GTPase FlhF